MVVAGGRHRQQDGEQDHADAVIEQRFARHLDFQQLRHAHRLEQAQHRHRIGRADERAEHQRPGQRHVEPEQLGQPPETDADHNGRDHHAERGHHGHRNHAPLQMRPIDMQGAGEQQERQHPVHNGFVEVDLFQDSPDIGDQLDAGKQHVNQQHGERGDNAHQQQADIARQMEKYLVEPAERRRQQHEKGKEIE